MGPIWTSAVHDGGDSTSHGRYCIVTCFFMHTLFLDNSYQVLSLVTTSACVIAAVLVSNVDVVLILKAYGSKFRTKLVPVVVANDDIKLRITSLLCVRTCQVKVSSHRGL